MIVRTLGVCRGSARIAGTRIPVWILHSLWASGATDRQIFDAYPSLSEEQLREVRYYIRHHKKSIARDVLMG